MPTNHNIIASDPLAITGLAWLPRRSLQVEFDCDDLAVEGLIDAPEWIPTGSHSGRIVGAWGSTTIDAETRRISHD